MKEAFNLLYRSDLNVTQATAAAADREWAEEGRHLWEFVRAAKKRGVVGYVGSSASGGPSEAE